MVVNSVGVYKAVQDLFSETARQFSSSTAIDNGKRRVTYGELADRVDKLRTALVARGVTSGSVVGIFFTDTNEIVTAILAILKARGVFCPLDPTFPAKRLAVMFESVSPEVVCNSAGFSGENASRNG